MCLFENQILFCKRAEIVGISAIKLNLQRLWLVAIATISSKTLKTSFLFMSAIEKTIDLLSPNLNKLFGPK